jgi:geranylgeranyl diphosphate synthase type I
VPCGGRITGAAPGPGSGSVAGVTSPSPPPSPSPLPPVLEQARDLVEPALRAAVANLDFELRLPADYHFGWASADGAAAEHASGKGVRSALALLGARATGADQSIAVPVGVAVELVHNFSLVHDDIIDGDVERRHRPTVWTQFSTGDAIIVGDALHTLAFQVLLENPHPASAAVARRLGRATAAMIRGQSNDMAFANRSGVTIHDCIAMEADKTGALLAFGVAGGATMAGAPEAVVSRLHEFGVELGIAFQAHDDILGVWGEPAATGKAAGNDLRERKRSMPVVLALSAGGRHAEGLRALFARDEIDDESVAEGIAILDDAGARPATAQIASEHLEAATAILDTIEIRSDARNELISLARFVVDRDH